MPNPKSDQVAETTTTHQAENDIPKQNAIGLWVFLIVITVLAALVILGALFFGVSLPEQDTSFVGRVTKPFKPAATIASGFGTYQEPSVSYTPSIPAYKTAANLANVENVSDFTLSNAAKQALVKNNFVIQASYHNEFFPLYEGNRYAYLPSFVTTDSVLHNYHLMFDRLLKQLEEQKLFAELQKLNEAMVKGSLAQYEAARGTAWEKAAKRNLAFFSVGSYLLDKETRIPDLVAEAVNQELVLIEAHAGIEVSPVMALGQEERSDLLMEDYSQYVPRGHYTKSENLKAYFKAMMWYGRLSFRVKNAEELRSAALITLLLEQPTYKESWNKIFEPVNFFVGKSDDLTYYEVQPLIQSVYGSTAALSDLIANDKFNDLFAAAQELRAPALNSIPIMEAAIETNKEEAIKAFRFMGQRYTVDADIFQRLIYRSVGDKTSSCANYRPENASCLDGARCLPNGLDIPAALGSKVAGSLLTSAGETRYACYAENLAQTQKDLGALDKAVWTQNLYWGWLYQLQPLLKEKTAGYPSFMTNEAWARKNLQTFLGSWSQLKHNTILYAKQVYAELGGGGLPDAKDDRGYVEPEPEIYARLAALLKMTREGLDSRDLLTTAMSDNLSKLEQLALSFKTISEKELNNQDLSEEEYELIRSYGGQLEHFWLEVNKDEPQFAELGPTQFLDQNPAAIIADVATDPNGKVLEVGTGRIAEIYAVVPVAGKLRLARGGVFSYYEFTWPMDERLTDEAWRELLDSEKRPEQPAWMQDFTIKWNQ